MALLKPTTKRLNIPHEPGEWIEIRRLSSMGNLDPGEMAKGREERFLEWGRLYVGAIVAWSYPDPITADVIVGKPNGKGYREGGLDTVTASWLLGEINKLANGDVSEEVLFPATSPLSAV
jgi:hypothetical protein